MSIKNIGRYQVKSELGRGGMATVYRAYDPQFKRDVAIKILPKEFLHDKEFRARFEREATTIAALEHPAIVPVYDFGEQDGQPYLVMRYMGGESLKERIDRGVIPLDEVVRIVDFIAPALDYAHSQNVIHRDLKPDNILFDQQNSPYLADFGIAKLAETSATLTGNAIVGTPAYMSPEQGRGEPDIDGRSDIYSLGAIIYEMLTNHLPYASDTPTGMIMKHLTQPVPNILAVDNSLPSGLQAVIAQALAKRKYVRFSTAVELADTLASAARGEEISIARAVSETMALPKDQVRVTGSRPGQPATRSSHSRISAARTPLPQQNTTSKKARRPVFKWLTGVMAVGVVGFGLFWGYSNFFAGNPFFPLRTSAAQTPTPEVSAEPEVMAPQPTNTIVITPSPEPSLTPQVVVDQQPAATEMPFLSPSPTLEPTPAGVVLGGADQLAFVSDNEIWISNLDGSNVQQLTSSGGSKTSTQWTLDGKAVTFVAGRCVQAVNIETLQVNTIFCANWSENLGGFEASSDGAYVALSLAEGMYILPYDFDLLSQIRTKEQLLASPYCTSYTEAPTKIARWSNDNKSIAVIATVTLQGRSVDMIKVIDVSRCGQPPVRIDEFPSSRFSMNRYDINPTIVDFDWDGESLFALAVNTINDFGEVYIYNMANQKAEVITPLDVRCCYRGFRWSPDDEYFVFSFQDSRFAKDVALYYVIYGTISAGAEYGPILMSGDVFPGNRENPQPSFRPFQP